MDDDPYSKWDDKLAELEKMVDGLEDDEDFGIGDNKPVLNQQPKTATLKSQENKKDWDSQLAEYDKMLLGEGTMDIEKSKMDPHKRPKQNVQPSANTIQNFQKPSPVTVSQQPQPQARAGNQVNKGGGIQKLLGLIEQTWDGNLLSSLAAIKCEIEWVDQALKDKNTPKGLLSVFDDKLKFLMENKTNLRNKINEGSIDENLYKKFSKNAFSNNVTFFTKMKNMGEKIIMSKISKRLNELQREQNILNGSGGFQKILSEYGISASTSSLEQPKQKMKFTSEKLQNDRPPKLDERPLSEFQPIASLSKFEEENTWPLEKKLLKLSERFKQYHNLATYLTQNLKEERKSELETFFLPLLGKGKKIMEELKSGNNVDISFFLKNEMKELDPKVFHGVDLPTFEFEYKKIVEKLKSCFKEESDFHKMAIKSMKTKEQKERAEESEKILESYKLYQKDLEEIRKSPFVPLPQYEIKTTKRSLAIENREIEANTMKFSLTQALECSSEKYFVKYSVKNQDSSLFTQETDQCNSSCVFNHVQSIPFGKDRRNVYLDIVKESITLRVFRKGFLGTKEVGVGEIPLQELETSNKFEGKADIKKEGKKVMAIQFIIATREPIGKLILKTVDVLFMKKFYPPFKRDEGVQEYVKQTMDAVQGVITQPTIPLNPSNQPTQQNPPRDKPPAKMDIEEVKEDNSKNMPEPTSDKMIFLKHVDTNPSIQKLMQLDSLPPGITKDDILKPENPEKAPVMSFIVKFDQEYESYKEELTMNGQRKEGRIMDGIWQENFTFKMKLENAFEKGNIDPPKYLAMLEQSLKRDSSLLSLYKSLGLKDWAAFCAMRIAFTNIEINDIKSME